MKAKERKKRNCIKHLANKKGAMCDDQVEIEQIITNYFEEMFASSRPPIQEEHRLPDDNIRWIGNSEGNFKVKDAYRLALGNEENATSSTGVDNVSQQLWKLNLPPKVLEFALRACWEALPHKANLCTKKVLTEASYFWCGATEHTLHVLRDCCWAANLCDGVTNFREWLAWVFEHGDNGKKEQFLMLA
ncbi:hypothetical protein RDABS01_003710 [Bienertia sinuspersici]